MYTAQQLKEFRRTGTPTQRAAAKIALFGQEGTTQLQTYQCLQCRALCAGPTCPETFCRQVGAGSQAVQAALYNNLYLLKACTRIGAVKTARALTDMLVCAARDFCEQLPAQLKCTHRYLPLALTAEEAALFARNTWLNQAASNGCLVYEYLPASCAEATHYRLYFDDDQTVVKVTVLSEGATWCAVQERCFLNHYGDPAGTRESSVLVRATTNPNNVKSNCTKKLGKEGFTPFTNWVTLNYV